MLPIHPPCGSHSQWSSAAEEGPRAGPDAAGKPDLAARLYQICPSDGWAAPSRKRPGVLNRNPSVKKEPNQNSSVKPKKEPNQIKRERPKSLAPSVGPQKASRRPMTAAVLLMAAALLDLRGGVYYTLI